MDWFRHYHGLCTDPKLHRIARAAKVSRGLVIAAWCAILEHASDATDRGDVSDLQPIDLAYLIDQKPGVATRIFEAIFASDLIDDGRIAAWEKRQKISDDGKIRVQRHRSMKAKTLRGKETDERSNVTQRIEQSRTEQIDKDSCSSVDERQAMNGHHHEPKQADLGRAFDERFWPAYPRKVGKAGARTKFITQAKRHGVDALMDGLERANAEWQRKGTEARFIPNPMTWLNQGRWEDEPEACRPRQSVNPMFTL